MDISYRLNNSEIEKLKKYKNPSILLKKNNILKNGKYKLHLTIGMFNKLLEQGQLQRYVFTDKRKQYYIQNGGSLASIFKAFVPYLKPIAKKILPAIGVATTSTLVSHGVNKALNKKKRGGNIKIDLSPIDIKKINNILEKLSNMKLTNYKSINQQTGKGIFTSLLIPLIGSMIPSLIGKGCKDNFFLKN